MTRKVGTGFSEKINAQNNEQSVIAIQRKAIVL